MTGNYLYRFDAPPDLRHVRQVRWIKRNVERAALRGDLRDSMGSFRTVSELSRRDAAKRVQSIVTRELILATRAMFLLQPTQKS